MKMNAKSCCLLALLASLALSDCDNENDRLQVIKPIELDIYECNVPSEAGAFDIRVLTQEEVALCNKYVCYSPEKFDSYGQPDIDARWYRAHLDGQTAHVVVSANSTPEERTGWFYVCSANTHDYSEVTFKHADTL